MKINNSNNKKRTTDRVQKKCNCITYSSSLVQNLVGAAFAMRCRAIMLISFFGARQFLCLSYMH